MCELQTQHARSEVSVLPPGFLQKRFTSAQRRECVCWSVTHVQYLLVFLQYFLSFMCELLCVLTVCDCDEERSVSPHCSDEGACQCKPGTSGRRCDSCLPGYTWRGNGSGCIGELLLCFYTFTRVFNENY